MRTGIFGSKSWLPGAVLAGVLAILPPPARGAEPGAIALDPPRTEGGRPLMQTLALRATCREFLPDALRHEELSELLWAAFGVNRPATGGRTAPSAMNAQEVDVYVAQANGLFLYDAKSHCLTRVASADLRGKTSEQAFARVAPVTLIYVADLARMTKAAPAQREFYAAIDTGYISQNVYLYCASAGLGTVVHDLNRTPLAEAMGLRPDQRIILAQAVGRPGPTTLSPATQRATERDEPRR